MKSKQGIYKVEAVSNKSKALGATQRHSAMKKADARRLDRSALIPKSDMKL